VARPVVPWRVPWSRGGSRGPVAGPVVPWRVPWSRGPVVPWSRGPVARPFAPFAPFALVARSRRRAHYQVNPCIFGGLWGVHKGVVSKTRVISVIYGESPCVSFAALGNGV
jgi:hypothetical protein